MANQAPKADNHFDVIVVGAGFAGMKFNAIATPTADDFDAWVTKVRQQGSPLNVEQYKQLAKKSENNPVQYYGSVQQGMFNYIVMQYMHPDSNMKSMGSMSGMEGMHDMGNMKGMDHAQHMQHMQHMKDMDADQTHSSTEQSSIASGEAE